MYEKDIPFQMGDRASNPHPWGQIPCLQDGELVLFESGAILMYLADKYDQSSMDTPAKRAEANKWCMWANASLDPVLFKENERGQGIGTGAGDENKKLRVLDTLLASRAYLLSSPSGGGVGGGGRRVGFRWLMWRWRATCYTFRSSSVHG